MWCQSVEVMPRVEHARQSVGERSGVSTSASGRRKLRSAGARLPLAHRAEAGKSCRSCCGISRRVSDRALLDRRRRASEAGGGSLWACGGGGSLATALSPLGRIRRRLACRGWKRERTIRARTLGLSAQAHAGQPMFRARMPLSADV